MHTDLIVAVPTWVLLAYLIAGVCFILALRGLSNPESSRRGNLIGMVGMAIAVVTTLITHAPVETIRTGLDAYHVKIDGRTALEILGAIVVGGGIGLIIARKIQMTAMPQLVAAFHSLVGMAAVLVGAAAYLNPEAFGIAVIWILRAMTRPIPPPITMAPRISRAVRPSIFTW
jgi:NAD(P) transhydrogenase subunit beta